MGAMGVPAHADRRLEPSSVAPAPIDHPWNRRPAAGDPFASPTLSRHAKLDNPLVANVLPLIDMGEDAHATPVG